MCECPPRTDLNNEGGALRGLKGFSTKPSYKNDGPESISCYSLASKAGAHVSEKLMAPEGNSTHAAGLSVRNYTVKGS